MKAAVITFPGSNCDRDMAVATFGEPVGQELDRMLGQSLPRDHQAVLGPEVLLPQPEPATPL